MKEMLKCKSIILFIVIMLGITFVGSYDSKLEDSKSIKENYLSYNLK